MPSVSFAFEWEISLMVWLQSFMSPALTAVAALFTQLGEDLVLIGLLGFLYWCYDKKLAKYVGINVVAGLALSPMLKNIAIRRRPYFDHPEIQCLRPVEKGADLYDVAAQGYSFPSMHASDTANFFGSIAAYSKKRRNFLIAAVLSFLTGLSRVLLGVHYPTDVLTGWVIGIVMILVMTWLQKKIPNELVLCGLLLLLALPGWFFCRSNDFYSAYGILAAAPLSFWIEKKWINFEISRKIPQRILRVVCGLLLFEVLSVLLKLPFPDDLLNSLTFTAHFLRSLRYFLCATAILGIYPAVFRFRPFK